jgi:phosphonatase-like hydrolase
MIKMVVFDMAGTTIDEDNVVYKTLQTVINKRGYHFTLEEVLAAGAGKEKSEAIRSILKLRTKRIDQNQADEMYRDFISSLKIAYDALAVQPEPGAEELFDILRRRGIRVVLNTGYSTDIASSLIKKIAWTEGVEFDRMITSGDVKNNRPDPEMIDLAMDIFRMQDPREVIKVGDSIIDIEEGQNAGCRLSIGITTGAHTYHQLRSANPDYILNNLLELIPILDTLE